MRPHLLPAALVCLAPLLPAQATSHGTQKYTAPVSESAFASFGRAIVGGDGRLIIGANGTDSQGAAFGYLEVGGTWTFQQKFTGSDTAAGDFFGFDLAMDGDLVAVTAQQHDQLGFNSGAAYVFQETGGTWTELQKLLPPDGAASDGFGSCVAMAGDLIVLGSSGDDDDGNISGSAYVFRRSGGTWSFEQKLTASTADAGDQFGWAAATDGQTILVSAIADEVGPAAVGAVFVFTHDGATWQEIQRITPTDGAAGDTFGWEIDLDGDLLAVGSKDHANSAGAVYLYRSGGGSFALEQKVVPGKVTPGDNFGWSVDVEGDRLVAGANGTTGIPTSPLAGALYQVHFDGTTWVDVHQWFTGEVVAGFPAPQYGMSCAIVDGEAFGGAPFGTGATITGAGAAYSSPLDDLGLDAVPNVVEPGQSLALETYGGLAGWPMGIGLQSIDGAPIFYLVALDVFDAAGEHVLNLPPQPGLAGFTLEFVAAGFWTPTKIGWSNEVFVPFF